MATVLIPTKAGFAKKVLAVNPNANVKVIREEWIKMGFPADKAPTSGDVSNAKSDIKGKRKTNVPRARLIGGVTKEDSFSKLSILKSIEDKLDACIADAKKVKSEDSFVEQIKAMRRGISSSILKISSESK